MLSRSINWQSSRFNRWISPSTGSTAAGNRDYALYRPASPSLPITPEIIQAQQATADLFYQNRLIPKRVDIQQAVWHRP
ncbi:MULTISPECIES: hypothetical protein [unclassified Pseudomonas]|uniref:hypothetical protein n=1 Tax=Pseudomonas sp. R1-18 TaxID=1632772 RepID=UPI003DA95358